MDRARVGRRSAGAWRGARRTHRSVWSAAWRSVAHARADALALEHRRGERRDLAGDATCRAGRGVGGSGERRAARGPRDRAHLSGIAKSHRRARRQSIALQPQPAWCAQIVSEGVRARRGLWARRSTGVPRWERRRRWMETRFSRACERGRDEKGLCERERVRRGRWSEPSAPENR